MFPGEEEVMLSADKMESDRDPFPSRGDPVLDVTGDPGAQDIEALNDPEANDVRDEMNIGLADKQEAEASRRNCFGVSVGVEFLNAQTPNGSPPHKLCLKVIIHCVAVEVHFISFLLQKGMKVMLLRNLYPERGLCNGTQLILKSFSRRLLHCIIAKGFVQLQLYSMSYHYYMYIFRSICWN